jgi:hypothetical protein
MGFKYFKVIPAFYCNLSENGRFVSSAWSNDSTPPKHTTFRHIVYVARWSLTLIYLFFLKKKTQKIVGTTLPLVAFLSPVQLSFILIVFFFQKPSKKKKKKKKPTKASLGPVL